EVDVDRYDHDHGGAGVRLAHARDSTTWRSRSTKRDMNLGASTSSATNAFSARAHPVAHGRFRTPSRSATVSPRVHTPSVSTSTRVDVHAQSVGSITAATARGSCMEAPSSDRVAA